jgi:hypothetical protein
LEKQDATVEHQRAVLVRVLAARCSQHEGCGAKKLARKALEEQQ